MRGKYQKALEIAEKVLMNDPECIEAAEEVADNLLSLERHEEATKAAKYVLKYEENSYIANFVLGFIASHQGKWDESIAFFQKSDRGQGNNPEILRCLGWALFQGNQKTEGLAVLNRALALRENDAVILCDIAACLLDINRIKEAKETIKKAKTLDPHNPRVQELFVIALEFPDFPSA